MPPPDRSAMLSRPAPPQTRLPSTATVKMQTPAPPEKDSPQWADSANQEMQVPESHESPHKLRPIRPDHPHTPAASSPSTSAELICSSPHPVPSAPKYQPCASFPAPAAGSPHSRTPPVAPT